MDPNKPAGVVVIEKPTTPPPLPTTTGGAKPVPIGTPVNPNAVTTPTNAPNAAG